ncbi:MAG TPA: hypothetical protein VH084_10660 [Mycobacterium sp.]|jgi:hypothetical protein|nr:hypothetical protein [Mycobacterium sp.]
MQTSAAEMLSVRFPICAFSHYRDAVVAVTDEGGRGVGAAVCSPECLTSERIWTELHDKLASEASRAAERSQSPTGKPARTLRNARTGRADSHDPGVARVQISVSSGGRGYRNHVAVQGYSKVRSTNNGWSAAVELDMPTESSYAGGLLGEGVDR